MWVRESAFIKIVRWNLQASVTRNTPCFLSSERLLTPKKYLKKKYGSEIYAVKGIHFGEGTWKPVWCFISTTADSYFIIKFIVLCKVQSEKVVVRSWFLHWFLWTSFGESFFAIHPDPISLPLPYTVYRWKPHPYGHNELNIHIVPRGILLFRQDLCVSFALWYNCGLRLYEADTGATALRALLYNWPTAAELYQIICEFHPP